MKLSKDTFRHLERIVRGFSNHRRIEILTLLERSPELSLAEISETLNINFKAAADHTRRLAIVGLVLKRSEGASVCHRLTDRGILILKFLRTLE